MDKKTIKRYMIISIGMLIVSLAYVLVTVPYGIINGGVTSCSLILHKLPGTGILPVSIWVAILEIVLVVLSYFFLGREVFEGSVFSCLFYVAVFNLLSFIMPQKVYDAIYSFGALGTNPVIPVGTAVELVIGAAALGFGYYLTVSRRATTAGMDTIALIIHSRHEKIPVAYAMYALNIIVLLLGLWTYGLRNVLMGIAFAGIQALTMNAFMRRGKDITSQ
ncbi:MAG: YitT family protein [Clostridia bacterium]|nr:YitT family protein [Clostridia bacterium]